VTMIQRSPTLRDESSQIGMDSFLFVKKVLPNSWAYRPDPKYEYSAFYGLLWIFEKLFPKFMKKLIMNAAAKQLPEGYPVESTLIRSYNPWDQRLCVVPDGDFFTSINKGQAHVVTGENFTFF